jgi:chromosome segregation ATPase
MLAGLAQLLFGPSTLIRIGRLEGQITQQKTRIHTMEMTQAELAASLRAAETQLKKIAAEVGGVQTEVGTLKTQVAELEAIIAKGGPITPELAAAAAAVREQVQIVDEKIPDPQPPPQPEPSPAS